MRNVNPGDLEQLAKLLEGKGGTRDKLDEAFTRASTLRVTDKLASLKPLRTWVNETGPDLRKRAAIARAEDGDPLGGLLWAGFSMKEAKLLALNPDIALLAGAAAASGERDFEWIKRQKNESLDDWRTRVKGEATTKITGDSNLGEVVSDYIRLTAFASEVPGAFKMAATGTLHLRKYLKNGDPLKAPGTTLAQILKGKAPSYIPARIARLGASIGARTPAPILNALTGTDALAQLHGGKLWAWEANVLKVGKNVANAKTAAGAGRLSAFAQGAGAAARTAGWWRATGVAGGVAATGLGIYDLVQQGNPVEAFKKDKAGYVADVSGVAFNASLTAAMVAPNPVTIGAAAVTGAVYGVALVVDNWDTVKKFPGKVADAGRWAGKKVGEAVDGVKKLGSAINPFD
ncbi:mucin-2 [Streptomyces sp. NPDC005322]|uniref:mucin-2 n=1 Tax=Streptomyces sp. NPDC005322 TaxID=3157032 RepID=UPI0033B311FA